MPRRRTSPLVLSALLTAALVACNSDNGLLPAPPTNDLPTLAVELLDLDYTFNQPVGITHAGDGSGRLFVIERPGTIRVIEEDEVALQPFLDLTGIVRSTGSEQGLLGLAFPPGYSDVDGHFYVHYTTIAGNGFAAGDSIVSRIPVSNGIADPSGEESCYTSRSRSRITTAVSLPSARTAFCISRSATVAAAVTRTATART